MWTSERVARRLSALAAEHGAPNRFQLHEVIGGSEGSAVLAVSRIARLQHGSVNGHLEAAGLAARYAPRQGPGLPACVVVERLDQQLDQAQWRASAAGIDAPR